MGTHPSTSTLIPSFAKTLGSPLTKQPISVLQINLGRRCNLACSHCHVEASPSRKEELSPQICQELIEVIHRFPQLQTIDLTGGAPEMLYGFKPLIEAARATQKQVIVRSNLTIYFEKGFGDIPDYCARHQVRIVASLPCYLSENVDKMRGNGVFDRSIKALEWLNHLGYGSDPNLNLDLVYNPPIPTNANFSLAPDQSSLKQDYKVFLGDNFGIVFNQLFTIMNLPIGRTKFHLQHRQLLQPYLAFLANNFNGKTVANLMCRQQLSVDYLGNIYDCDFNQMANVPARNTQGQPLTLRQILEAETLDLIGQIQTKAFCYGCTAGSGSSCGGALI